MREKKIAGVQGSIVQRIHELLAGINLDGVCLQDVRSLYGHGVNINRPCYPKDGLEVEVGFKNANDQNLDLFDHFLNANNFNYSRSCGLARQITFSDEASFIEFFVKLAKLMYAGNLVFLNK